MSELKALLWSSPWGGEVSLPRSDLAPSVSASRWCFSSPGRVPSLVSVQTIIIAPVMTGFVASFIKSVCFTGQLPRIVSISVLLSVMCRLRCWRPGWWSPYIACTVPVMDTFWWGCWFRSLPHRNSSQECMFIVYIYIVFIIQMHVWLMSMKIGYSFIFHHLANFGQFCHFHWTWVLHSIIGGVQIALVFHKTPKKENYVIFSKSFGSDCLTMSKAYLLVNCLISIPLSSHWLVMMT